MLCKKKLTPLTLARFARVSEVLARRRALGPGQKDPLLPTAKGRAPSSKLVVKTKLPQATNLGGNALAV